MASDAPRFLQYRAADHAAARATEYIRDLVEYVEYEQNQAITAVLHAVRKRDLDESSYALAKSDAMGALVDQFWKEDPIVMSTDEEEEFVDAAMPPSARSHHVRSE